jgi:hypothetical protein
VTACTRDLYGACPGFALDAADRGTGKTFLARLVRIIATGKATAQSVSPLRADDAETAKAIVAAVLAGTAALHIDELPRGQNITSRVISELITNDGTMTQRVLGVSRSIGIPPMLCTVCGNNIELGADMQRRFVPIRMVHAGAELAFERSGFRHPDLGRWVWENRPRLLAAAHTIAAYGIQQAPTNLPAIGSFEGWRDVVLAGLHFVHLSGIRGSDLVVEGRREFIDSQDAEGDAWLPIMQAWESQFGNNPTRAKDAYETLTGLRPPIDLPVELRPEPGQSPTGVAKSWGRALQRRRATAVRSDDTIYRLKCLPDSKNGNRYFLEVQRKDVRVVPAPDPLPASAPTPLASLPVSDGGEDLDPAA